MVHDFLDDLYTALFCRPFDAQVVGDDLAVVLELEGDVVVAYVSGYQLEAMEVHSVPNRPMPDDPPLTAPCGA